MRQPVPIEGPRPLQHDLFNLLDHRSHGELDRDQDGTASEAAGESERRARHAAVAAQTIGQPRPTFQPRDHGRRVLMDHIPRAESGLLRNESLMHGAVVRRRLRTRVMLLRTENEWNCHHAYASGPSAESRTPSTGSSSTNALLAPCGAVTYRMSK